MDKKLNLLILLMFYFLVAEGKERKNTLNIDQVMMNQGHKKGHGSRPDFCTPSGIGSTGCLNPNVTWMYDKNSDTCEPINSGGCTAAKGVFESEAECRRVCKAGAPVKKIESCETCLYTPDQGHKKVKFMGSVPFELVILNHALQEGQMITMEVEGETLTFNSSQEVPIFLPELTHRYFTIHADSAVQIAASNDDNCTSSACGEINGTCLHEDIHTCLGGNWVVGLCPGPAEVKCCLIPEPSIGMKREVEERQISASECEQQGGVCKTGGCQNEEHPVPFSCPNSTMTCCRGDNPCHEHRPDGEMLIRPQRIVNGASTNTIDHSYMAYLRVLRWHLYCYRWGWWWWWWGYPYRWWRWWYRIRCFWFWSFEMNRCSGTVISDKLVLTSAQCTQPSWRGNWFLGIYWHPWYWWWYWFCWTFPVRIRVDLGFDQPLPYPASYGVPWFHIISNGDFTYYDLDYDVSLLWVQEGIATRFERIKVPECYEYLDCCKVSMLGKGYSTVPMPFIATSLYEEYQADVIPQSDCPVSAYPLTPRMFCTRKTAPPPSQTICYGDVGGPVLCNYNQCNYQLGVISWKDYMWWCNGGDDNVHAKLTDPELCNFVNTKKQCAESNPGVYPSNTVCPVGP